MIHTFTERINVVQLHQNLARAVSFLVGGYMEKEVHLTMASSAHFDTRATPQAPT